MVIARIQTVGFNELQTAIKRNPQVVANESKKFFLRATIKYNASIRSRPWTVGATGGGSPVDSRNLVESHKTNIGKTIATIGPDFNRIKYAWRIHEGFVGPDSKGRVYNQAARPWLDYVKKQNEGRVESLYREMLKNITKDLAK